MNELQTLNSRFSIPGQLTFVTGPGGLTVAEINNVHASASIFLLGGHIATYQPHGAQPALMMSAGSYYEVGKALRGGIPICWPWFGIHPTITTLPGHGVVRNQLWSVKATYALPDGSTSLRLVVTDNADTRALWDHAFELELEATIGKTLKMELVSRNPGITPYGYVGGLHPYFNISDIHQIKVSGLEGCTYLDAVDQFIPKQQSGALTFTSFTNRVYQNTPAKHWIEDPRLRRRIFLTKSSSQTTVVWNPGVEKASTFPDFVPEEYLRMVCVEPVTAWRKDRLVNPGEEDRLGMTIWVEPA